MARTTLTKGIAAFSALVVLAGGALIASLAPAAQAKAPAHETNGHHLVGLRVESATHVVGLHGPTRLRVIGIHADGGTRLLKSHEAKLHVVPARAARVLANHSVYPKHKGILRVHATSGGLKSKPLQLDALAF